MKKKPPSPFKLWSLLESIGLFLTDDLEKWYRKQPVFPPPTDPPPDPYPSFPTDTFN